MAAGKGASYGGECLMSTNQQTEKPEQPPYVLPHLLCGCTVMQRQEANPGLFYLLQHLEKKPVILYCPEHRRQKVARGRWGRYSFGETAESRYDYVYAQTTCPNCRQGTLVTYNPYTSSIGEEIPSKCVSCKKPFMFVVQNRRERVAVEQQGKDLFTLYAEEWKQIERSLSDANEGLLGLHRYGVMNNDEYADIANLLLEARERLKKRLQAKDGGQK